MSKPKVIYKVQVTIASYYKIVFTYTDIRDAQYLTDAILLNLDESESDAVSVAIYPELPDPEEESKEEDDE